eukprot:8637515-Prorocentrum_lima.AAC.1
MGLPSSCPQRLRMPHSFAPSSAGSYLSVTPRQQIPLARARCPSTLSCFYPRCLLVWPPQE